MARLDAIALVSTGIISSLLTLSLRAAPAFAKTENLVSNVREERTLPVVFSADVSSRNGGNPISQNGTKLALLLVGVGATGVILSLNRQNKTLSPQSAHQQHNTSIEQANPRLRKELIRLVGGDHQTANRLVNGIKQSHPGKSINWAVEKAIYDLERDR